MQNYKLEEIEANFCYHWAVCPETALCTMIKESDIETRLSKFESLSALK